jgi:hypothetical protein
MDIQYSRQTFTTGITSGTITAYHFVASEVTHGLSGVRVAQFVVFCGHNIFGNFSSEEYGEVINLLKKAILATDLSIHIQ